MARTIPLTPAGRDPGPPPFARIGIVGLGSVGGSIGQAARAVWRSALVVGVDRSPVLEAAQRMHAVDVSADDLGMLAEVDLIVLTTPPAVTVSLLDELPELLAGAAVVTDTSRLKPGIRDAALRLPGRLTFVGGAPDVPGTGSVLDARADLFRDRPWRLAPLTPGESDGVTRLQAFIRGLGAVPGLMAAEQLETWPIA